MVVKEERRRKFRVQKKAKTRKFSPNIVLNFQRQDGARVNYSFPYCWNSVIFDLFGTSKVELSGKMKRKIRWRIVGGGEERESSKRWRKRGESFKSFHRR